MRPISTLSKADKEMMVEVYQLAVKMRDQPYDSREEFLEDLSTVCDRLSLLISTCVTNTFAERMENENGLR